MLKKLFMATLSERLNNNQNLKKISGDPHHMAKDQTAQLSYAIVDLVSAILEVNQNEEKKLAKSRGKIFLSKNFEKNSLLYTDHSRNEKEYQDSVFQFEICIKIFESSLDFLKLLKSQNNSDLVFSENNLEESKQEGHHVVDGVTFIKKQQRELAQLAACINSLPHRDPKSPDEINNALKKLCDNGSLRQGLLNLDKKELQAHINKCKRVSIVSKFGMLLGLGIGLAGWFSGWWLPTSLYVSFGGSASWGIVLGSTFGGMALGGLLLLCSLSYLYCSMKEKEALEKDYDGYNNDPDILPKKISAVNEILTLQGFFSESRAERTDQQPAKALNQISSTESENNEGTLNNNGFARSSQVSYGPSI